MSSASETIEEVEIATTQQFYRNRFKPKLGKKGLTKDELEALAEMARKGQIQPKLRARLVEAVVKQRDDGLWALILRLRKA